VRFSAKTL